MPELTNQHAVFSSHDRWPSGSIPTNMAFRPVGEGLVPSRPVPAQWGRTAGDKPPPYRNYRNDRTDAMAISMTAALAGGSTDADR